MPSRVEPHQWDGPYLVLADRQLAGQADGAVVARIGDTVVLATATAARKVREGTDFFPLTVDIEERMYAAGKIPGRSSAGKAERATRRS